MTLKILILSVAISPIFSCSSQQDESKPARAAEINNLLNCYRFINNNDTVILKITDVNGFVTGTLVYDFYEKDKNMGTIQGQMKGELLIADYSFFSEGIKSVRPVAFKKNEKTFIEGYGETVDTKGKTTFRNADSLDFNHSVVLTEFDCEK